MLAFQCALVLLVATSSVVRAEGVPLGGKKLFLNGINVSWNHFGTDVGSHDEWGALYDSSFFETMFAEIAAAGGNSVRWWIHCDGRSSPEWEAPGKVSGLDSNFFEDLDGIFDAAARHGIKVMPTLWSFDLAKPEPAAGTWGGGHIELIKNVDYTNAYVQKVLTPMAQRYAGHPGLGAWEICNEPEWMLEGEGSTPQRAGAQELQRWTGILAAAIHRADPNALVTTGSASLKWNWDNPHGSERNLWSDEALLAATAGDSLARLDFYQVHYYSWMRGSGWTYSPFDKEASHWELDKPIVIGEFSAKGETGYKTVEEMYQWAYGKGYAGAFGWTYKGVDEHGSWQEARQAVALVGKTLSTGLTRQDQRRVEQPTIPFPMVYDAFDALGRRRILPSESTR